MYKIRTKNVKNTNKLCKKSTNKGCKNGYETVVKYKMYPRHILVQWLGFFPYIEGNNIEV